MEKRIISTLKSPCRDCDGADGGKDNRRCAECGRRMAYVAALEREAGMGRKTLATFPVTVPTGTAPQTKRKTCRKCGNSYPLTDEYFYRHKAARDGFAGVCKSCRRKQSQAAYKKRHEARARDRAKRMAAAPADGRPETTPLQPLFAEAAAVINGARQDVYGSPEDSFARIGRYWGTYLDRDITALDVAHLMVLFKLARIQGQSPHRDNYVDLAGYTAIAADRLAGRKEP